MAHETKLRKIGNSYGIILPREVIETMKVEEGQTLYLTEGAERTVRVTAAGPGFEEKMEIARRGMQRYRNALRELAK